MERLTDEQRERASDSVLLAESVAARYTRIFPEYEQDLRSAASYGAVRAAATYTPEMNGVWERWSGLCISGEIKDFLNSSYCKHRKLWTQDALEAVAFVQSAIEDGRADANLSFDHLIGSLPAKHRELCYRIYTEGMTAGEAGMSLGYTANHGNKLHRAALAMLREQFAD